MKAHQIIASVGAITAAFALAQTASAAPIYARVSVGETSNVAVEGIDLNGDFAYEGALGTSIGPVRVEVGAGHASANFAGAIEADALVYSATAYLDLPVTERFGVFAGAGLDYLDASANFGYGSLDADGDGWHYTVGGAYRLSETMIGEVAFKHTEASLDSDAGSFDAEYDTIQAGVRLRL